MLKELSPEKYSLFPQPSFFEQVTDDFALTGSADLLMGDDSTNEAILIDFKNAHSRERMTKDQLVIYQIGLERTTQYTIHKAGYLLFNPRLRQWKWFDLRSHYREKLLCRLKEATEELLKGEIAFNWNHYTCTRFCDVRFACDMFRHHVGKYIKPGAACLRLRISQPRRAAWIWTSGRRCSNTPRYQAPAC